MENMLHWSVTATAGMPASATRLTSGLIRTVPLTSEYSVWTWRWTKAGGMEKVSDFSRPVASRITTLKWFKYIIYLSVFIYIIIIRSGKFPGGRPATRKIPGTGKWITLIFSDFGSIQAVSQQPVYVP